MIRQGFRDPWTLPDDEDLYTGPPRREIVKPDKDNELSDYVLMRLRIARELAIQRFLETNKEAA